MTFAESAAKAMAVLSFGLTIAPFLVWIIKPDLEEPSE